MTRVERWERRAEIPLLLLAAAILVAYAWPVLNPHLSVGTLQALLVLSWSMWLAFAADFVIRLALAEHRRLYALRHWYDVALFALLMLRPRWRLRLSYGSWTPRLPARSPAAPWSTSAAPPPRQ